MSERIGNWIVDSAIGEGGMGAVYAAHHVLFPERLAAVKVMKKGAFPGGEERFVREIRLLSQLRHPAIVAVLDSGADGDRVYFAMELLGGEELGKRISRGPIGLAEALPIFAALGAALQTAHASGVYHRDLKPENVLLTSMGPKLLDFGIALPEGGTRHTAASTVIGTPAYMPPEVFLDGAAPVPRGADVYALGQMLYEALVGKRAFELPDGLSPSQGTLRLIAMKAESEALDPGPAFPESLRALVRGATAPNPAERVATVEPFVALHSGPTSDVRPPTAPVARTVRGSGAPGLGMALWLVILGGCGGFAVGAMVTALVMTAMQRLPRWSAPPPAAAPAASAPRVQLDGCGATTRTARPRSMDVAHPTPLFPGQVAYGFGGQPRDGTTDLRNYWQFTPEDPYYRLVLEVVPQDVGYSEISAQVWTYSLAGEKKSQLSSLSEVAYHARSVTDWRPSSYEPMILVVEGAHRFDYRLALLRDVDAIPSPYFDTCPQWDNLEAAPVSMFLDLAPAGANEGWLWIERPPGAYDVTIDSARFDGDEGNIVLDVQLFNVFGDWSSKGRLEGIDVVRKDAHVVQRIDVSEPRWLRLETRSPRQNVKVSIAPAK